MAYLREFQVRLLRANGAMFQIVPVMAENEPAARERAASLCAELGVARFELSREMPQRSVPPAQHWQRFQAKNGDGA